MSNETTSTENIISATKALNEFKFKANLTNLGSSVVDLYSTH